MTPGFWNGKRVVITGHTGFKGSWLTLWLSQLGANVTGIALEPSTTPSIFTEANIAACCDHQVCDIRDAERTASLIKAANPEIIFHLAAQPLVRLSYREPLETFASNIMGTANVLNALRECPDCRTAIMITTDKVYHNREWAWPYREDDTLGGHDPYSASKAACEIVINSFRQSFLNDAGVAVASVRAGNVIGGGDWSEDRLIPDAVRAWTSGQTLSIRRPDSVRPWQHVLEPLRGYIELAEKLDAAPELAGAYNFGPRTHMAATVRRVIDIAPSAFGSGDVAFGTEVSGPHEAGLLMLDVSKAKQVLGIDPCLALEAAVATTMHWYRDHHEGVAARELCVKDIRAYTAAAGIGDVT